MTDAVNRAPEQDEEGFERMLAKHSAPTPEVSEAMAELESARAELSASLDHLTDATHAALDIPAKVKSGSIDNGTYSSCFGLFQAGDYPFHEPLV